MKTTLLIFLIALMASAASESIRVGAFYPTIHAYVLNELKPVQLCFPPEGPLDRIYALPSQAQIEKINRLSRTNERAVRDSHDCDEFALEYYVEARRFARKTFLPPGAALAVGALFVRIDAPLVDLGITWEVSWPQYHVLNVFLREDGQWVVVEPQNGRMTLWKSLQYEGNLTVIKILI